MQPAFNNLSIQNSAHRRAPYPFGTEPRYLAKCSFAAVSDGQPFAPPLRGVLPNIPLATVMYAGYVYAKGRIIFQMSRHPFGHKGLNACWPFYASRIHEYIAVYGLPGDNTTINVIHLPESGPPLLLNGEVDQEEPVPLAQTIAEMQRGSAVSLANLGRLQYGFLPAVLVEWLKRAPHPVRMAYLARYGENYLLPATYEASQRGLICAWSMLGRKADLQALMPVATASAKDWDEDALARLERLCSGDLLSVLHKYANEPHLNRQDSGFDSDAWLLYLAIGFEATGFPERARIIAGIYFDGVYKNIGSDAEWYGLMRKRSQKARPLVTTPREMKYCVDGQFFGAKPQYAEDMRHAAENVMGNLTRRSVCGPCAIKLAAAFGVGPETDTPLTRLRRWVDEGRGKHPLFFAHSHSTGATHLSILPPTDNIWSAMVRVTTGKQLLALSLNLGMPGGPIKVTVTIKSLGSPTLDLFGRMFDRDRRNLASQLVQLCVGDQAFAALICLLQEHVDAGLHEGSQNFWSIKFCDRKYQALFKGENGTHVIHADSFRAVNDAAAEYLAKLIHEEVTRANNDCEQPFDAIAVGPDNCLSAILAADEGVGTTIASALRHGDCDLGTLLTALNLYGHRRGVINAENHGIWRYEAEGTGWKAIFANGYYIRDDRKQLCSNRAVQVVADSIRAKYIPCGEVYTSTGPEYQVRCYLTAQKGCPHEDCPRLAREANAKLWMLMIREGPQYCAHRLVCDGNTRLRRVQSSEGNTLDYAQNNLIPLHEQGTVAHVLPVSRFPGFAACLKNVRAVCEACRRQSQQYGTVDWPLLDHRFMKDFSDPQLGVTITPLHDWSRTYNSPPLTTACQIRVFLALRHFNGAAAGCHPTKAGLCALIDLAKDIVRFVVYKEACGGGSHICLEQCAGELIEEVIVVRDSAHYLTLVAQHGEPTGEIDESKVEHGEEPVPPEPAELIEDRTLQEKIKSWFKTPPPKPVPRYIQTRYDPETYCEQVRDIPGAEHFHLDGSLVGVWNRLCSIGRFDFPERTFATLCFMFDELHRQHKPVPRFTYSILRNGRRHIGLFAPPCTHYCYVNDTPTLLAALKHGVPH